MNAAMSGGFYYSFLLFALILAIRGIYLLVSREAIEPTDKRSIMLKRLEKKYRQEGAVNPKMMAEVHLDALRYVDYFQIDAAKEVESGKAIARVKETWLRSIGPMITGIRGNTEMAAALVKTIEEFVSKLDERDVAGRSKDRYKSAVDIIDELFSMGARV